MNAPKQHHHTPKSFLRRFAGADGRLYFYDKRRSDLGVGNTIPENLFKRRHLYSTIARDGTKDPAFEIQLAGIEGRVHPILERMVAAVRAGELPQLSPEEKAIWDEFFATLWMRSPDNHERHIPDDEFRATVFEHLEVFERNMRPLTSEERDQFESGEFIERLQHNVRAAASVAVDTEAVEALSKRGLGFMRITKPNKSFVVGSMPMIKISDGDESNIAHQGVEMWAPIAYDVAVSPMAHPGEEVIVDHPTDEWIRALNCVIFDFSTVVGARSETLLKSLVKRR